MEEHILVGLSSAPSNARIIRTAATMAAAFGCKFTALFVRTPGYDAMSDENKERLRTNTELAKSLGAIVETVFGDDVSYQIAEYAQSNPSCMQTHLLFQYGEIRNESKDIAVYHGSFGHQRDAECLHPCAVR